MKLFPEPQKCIFFNTYSDIDILKNKTFVHNEVLNPQEYIIKIDESGVTIESSHEQGTYYAKLTLQQMADQQTNQIQHCYIHDFPDFEERGVMIDVGRFCIPTMENLYRIVDILSAVKINQFQLYFEGFPFAYPSHPQVWKNRDVLTGDDIIQLDEYCKSKFIELVPCQNAFGHMKQWLVRDEYHELGESPEGFQMPWGYERDCSTLDPLNPQSFELTKSLYFDILPYFSSSKINICCDETFELGKGKNQGKDSGTLYYDYLMKIYTAIKEKYPNRTMMFWGDVIGEHPEYLQKLPKDLVPLKWTYTPNTLKAESLDVYKNAEKEFYICPTVHTHCTIAGKTLDMMTNINECAVMGNEAGAQGILITKWGDIGNWDSVSVSFLPYVYGGVKSWNSSVEYDIEEYVNKMVFKDESELMAKIAMELGDFYHIEPKYPSYNGNGIIRVLNYYQLDDKDHDLDFVGFPPYEDDYFDKVLAHVYKYQDLLAQVDLKCEDGELVVGEYKLAIRMLIHGAMLGKYKQKKKEDRAQLWDLYDDIQTIIADYRKCWLMRNRNVGLDESLYKLYELKRQYQQHLGVGHVKI